MNFKPFIRPFRSMSRTDSQHIGERSRCVHRMRLALSIAASVAEIDCISTSLSMVVAKLRSDSRLSLAFVLEGINQRIPPELDSGPFLLALAVLIELLSSQYVKSSLDRRHLPHEAAAVGIPFFCARSLVLLGELERDSEFRSTAL